MRCMLPMCMHKGKGIDEITNRPRTRNSPNNQTAQCRLAEDLKRHHPSCMLGITCEILNGAEDIHLCLLCRDDGCGMRGQLLLMLYLLYRGDCRSELRGKLS